MQNWPSRFYQPSAAFSPVVGSPSANAAALFLAAHGPNGVVFDFADGSIAIDDPADVLDFQSQGQVFEGSLIGPGARLTYPAPSPKLLEQQDGVLRFQAHNLFLWSSDFSNAAWVATSCTKSGTNEVTIELGAGTAAKFIAQSPIFTNGSRGVFAIEAKAGTHQFIQLWNTAITGGFANFDLVAGTVGTVGAGVTATISPTSNGYYLCRIEWVSATAANCRVYGAPSASAVAGQGTESTGTFLLRKPHVRRTPSVDTYIDTTTAAAFDLPYVWSGGVRQGLQMELAATNIYLDNLNPITRNISVSSLTYTLSFRGTGSVTLSGAATGTLNGTGENDRVSLTVAATAGTLTVTPSGPVTLVQVETGSTATSEIITYGASVTRASDSSLSALGSMFGLNAAEGTLYLESRYASAAVAASSGIGLHGAAAGSNRVQLRTTSALVSSGGAVSAQLNAGLANTVNAKRAVRYQLNNFAFSYNGSSPLLDTNGSPPVDLTTLDFNTDRLAAAGFNGIVTRVAWFSRALSNSELQAITT